MVADEGVAARRVFAEVDPCNPRYRIAQRARQNRNPPAKRAEPRLDVAVVAARGGTRLRKNTRKPGELNHREAAALPLIFITAWEGLVDRAHVKAGQKVLIQGGGGVGHIVVQLARAFDATAFAVDSAAKHEFLTGLGATAIDYRSMNVEQYVAKFTDGRGFDIIYDTIGGETLDASFRAVRRFGHVVSALGWGTHALAPLSFRAASYSGVFTLLPLLTGEGREHHGEILAQAAKLVDAGKIKPRVDPRRFTLQTVEEAYRAIEERGTSGKIVVEID